MSAVVELEHAADPECVAGGAALGGVGEAIEHGVTGYGFPEADVDAMSSALIELLRNDDLATRMSVAARARACSMFDLRQCTTSLESLYDESIARR